MLDFHTHILPGIDDGSRDVEQSLEMLRAEARMGIREVIATSHYYATQGSPQRYLRRRERAWEALKLQLEESMPRVRLGAEVQYFEGICSVEDIGDLRIAGSDLLLLEMPTIKWTQRMLEDILELNDRPGIQVIMAHIDRYQNLIPKDLVEELVQAGVLIQVNTSFFTSWQTSGKAKKMLQRGLIHFVGSDCHNMAHRCPNWDRISNRIYPQLEEVTEHYARRFLRDGADVVY